MKRLDCSSPSAGSKFVKIDGQVDMRGIPGGGRPGTPPPPRVEIFPPPIPGIGTMLNNGPSREAVIQQASTTIVRVGLWDHAWDGQGSLRTGATARGSYIDGDTRCFHFRVYDKEAYDNGLQEVRVRWCTRHTNTQTDDPAADLTLKMVVGQDGYYVSRAVMLVTDRADRESPEGVRLRRITVSEAHPLTSEVYVEYEPAEGDAVVTATATVFDHNAGNAHSRKRLRVNLVNVRSTPGGASTLTDPRALDVKAAFHAVYAVCGVYVEVKTFAVDPPARCTGWPGAYAVKSSNGYDVRNPSVVLSNEGFLPNGLPMVTPSQSELDLIGAVRATVGYAANDVYVLFVNALYTGPVPQSNASPRKVLKEETGGEAFPDSQTDPQHPTARGFAIIALNGVPAYSVVHEVTHLTTNFNNPADGHFDLAGQSAAAATGKTKRNLMHRFNLVTANSYLDPKRLWDTAENNNTWIPNFTNDAQVTAIRASRFVRPY